MKWIGGVLLALNQLLNALAGGDPDESFSSRMGQMRERGAKTGTVFCEFLDLVDPRDGDGPKGDHCEMSVELHRVRVAEELERITEKVVLPAETP